MKLSVCLPILSDVSPCGAALMTLSTVIINTQSRVQSVRAGAGLQATGPSDLHRNPSVLLGDSTSRRPPSCVDHVIYTPTDLVTQTRFVSAAFFHAHDLGLVESRHNENHFENRSTFLNTKPELSIKARERTYSADSQSPTDSCGKRWRAHYEQVSHNRYPSPPRRRLQLDGVKARRRYFFLYERRTGSAVLAQYMRMSDTQTDTHTTLHAPSVAMGHISRIVCVRCAYKHKMA